MRAGGQRLGKRGLIWLVVGLVGVGPWPSRPSDPGAYTAEPWFRDTCARLDQTPLVRTQGPFRAGVAQVDLRGPHPVNLAGHPGQMGQPSVGQATPCAARALTVAVANQTITVINADLLMVNEALASAVAARAEVDRGTLFFTSTHTHTGPGAWGLHPLERLVAGTYDPAEFQHLTRTLATAVADSRRRLLPVAIAFLTVPCPGLQINRIEPGQATTDTLAAWVLQTRPTVGSPRTLATLVSFGAHATIAGSTPPHLDGDYPADLAARLAERVDAGTIVFAAGTVGDSAPVRPRGLGPRAGAAAYGDHLAAALAGAWPSAQFAEQGDLVNLPLRVDLPAVCWPMGTMWLRFSPALSWVLAPRRTHLHLVQLGPAYLVGFPGDLAGHLARRLEASLPIVATSFNGDYKGYLVSRDTWLRRPCYETRWMSFFGADLGEALAVLAQRGLDRVGGQPR